MQHISQPQLNEIYKNKYFNLQIEKKCSKQTKLIYKRLYIDIATNKNTRQKKKILHASMNTVSKG